MSNYTPQFQAIVDMLTAEGIDLNRVTSVSVDPSGIEVELFVMDGTRRVYNQRELLLFDRYEKDETLV